MRKKYWFIIVGILAALVLILGIRQVVYVRDAHTTFEKYYAFRGCAELVERTDTYGICKTQSGQTIKIVLYEGKWYLDGDLPNCWLGGICL